MYQLLAVCPMGLEAVVSKEIQELGYTTTVENGKIFFEGDEAAIVKCNLWLRTADRIKIVVGQFNAKHLMNYLKRQKNSLGKQSSKKKETFQYKVVV